MEQKTFIRACKDHFGYGEGKSLAEFSKELKALTAKDREDMVKEFDKIGVLIVEPQAA